MAVVDADSGKVIVTYPIGDHVDVSAFDPETKLVFNSLGEGNIAVFHQDSPDKYTFVENIPTAQGSKTMALDLRRIAFLSHRCAQDNLQSWSSSALSNLVPDRPARIGVYVGPALQSSLSESVSCLLRLACARATSTLPRACLRGTLLRV